MIDSEVGRFGQEGAADDDLAAGLALALVDGPECFETFDPGLEDGEPLDVILDLVQRRDVAAVMDSDMALVPQRRLKLFQAQGEGVFFGEAATGLAVGFTGGPELLAALFLGLGAGPVLGAAGIAAAASPR